MQPAPQKFLQRSSDIAMVYKFRIWPQYNHNKEWT